MTGNGKNIVLLRAREFVLCGNYLDIVGRADLKAILREFEFSLCKAQALPGNRYLLGSRIQIQQRLANVFIDPTPQIGNLIVDALDATGKLLRFAIAIAIEDGKVDLALNQARRLHTANTAPNRAEVAIDAELWIEARMVGALLFNQTLPLAVKRKVVCPREQRSGGECCRVKPVQRSVNQRLGQLQRRARTHAEIPRQSQQRLFQLILGHEFCLPVVRKLYLCAQHVHACRRPGIVFIFCQL